jgi:hypothetical protein
MKKLDKTWIKKFERGELREGAFERLKEEMPLYLFAWKNRLALKHEPETFVVEENPDMDRVSLEHKYAAKFLRGEIKEGKLFALLKSWPDPNLEVNVWNYQIRVIVRDEEGKPIQYECDSDIQARLDDLSYNSVQMGGGYINRSGIYPPNESLIRFFWSMVDKKKILLEKEV